MLKNKTGWLAAFIGTFSLVITASAFGSPPIRLGDAGPLLPVFVVLGGILVFLQFAPALLLMFSFIGTVLRLMGRPKRLKGQALQDGAQIIGLHPLIPEKK